MGKNKILKFKQMLIEKRNRILNHVTNIAIDSKEIGKNGTQDIGDEASNIYSQNLLMQIGENEIALLKEIEAALTRIEEGRYGECEECGEPIPEKRLEITPWARLCVKCQREKEAKIARR
ncbi:MAG: TraR/DksA family transcriptional regulator [Thermoplasmata archaeon]|nr:TraR/DksA family transcriptional regulator [Deltaproteobacteria bacterium]RLA89079.1 MAG: TraR/DksA family transcriptional regulator [Deltaproteobacteria bacterium]RLF33355.1 MAG: TraR/DksA family transcriptional regulator [Thermoplasmata archaeon]